jgi:hypothetical protein
VSKKQIALTILIFGLVGFTAQGIYAQVQKSNSISQWDKLKPKLEESFADVGDEKLVESLRERIVGLMEARATLSNVDATTAQRTDLQSSSEIRQTVEELVSKVWTSRNLTKRTDDIIAGWNIAKLHPNYRPFTNARYVLDSWQGIRVAEGRLSAEAIVTGTMTYVYDDGAIADSLDQSQIKVVKENGIWLLDETVMVYVGRSN